MSASLREPRRELLATGSGLSSVTRVYAAGDALDIEEGEGIDVCRRRILLDEILLVTRHRERGTAFVVTTLAFSVIFTGLSVVVSFDDRSAALALFAFLALPFLASLLWRLTFGVDVVTVFGKRSKVAMRFSPIRGRAESVYGRVCRQTRAAQRAAPRPPDSGAGEAPHGGAVGGL